MHLYTQMSRPNVTAVVSFPWNHGENLKVGPLEKVSLPFLGDMFNHPERWTWFLSLRFGMSCNSYILGHFLCPKKIWFSITTHIPDTFFLFPKNDKFLPNLCVSSHSRLRIGRAFHTMEEKKGTRCGKGRGSWLFCSSSSWWFQIFFIFIPNWGRFPIWLIFFRRVETTN